MSVGLHRAAVCRGGEEVRGDEGAGPRVPRLPPRLRQGQGTGGDVL